MLNCLPFWPGNRDTAPTARVKWDCSPPWWEDHVKDEAADPPVPLQGLTLLIRPYLLWFHSTQANSGQAHLFYIHSYPCTFSWIVSTSLACPRQTLASLFWALVKFTHSARSSFHLYFLSPANSPLPLMWTPGLNVPQTEALLTFCGFMSCLSNPVLNSTG